ncbi:Major Facilitator Superfamily protein [Paraburkholderia steynii]|uniref:Major Facilitator Superfamily protein n=1 Tax=Paraburkholderia steynii TaxID=1245441 RepID=A0A7Z7FJI7_9BURK|nr:MFS transporter [Paraburkholderia steynii]SDI56109.1 Major Facilitator Superfamily protein [Paraburkholderia steynii]
MRVLMGLGGIFVGAIMAGLNNRVGALALADVRGALGLGLDDASWLSTVYSAGELMATPFATWFAITFSLRLFHRTMLCVCVALAMLLPFVHDLNLLLCLRFLQGISCGALIPILMMAALKFLPPSIRLYGLALYAMTATFAPNVAIWLAGWWTDGFYDWRWVYWQIIPLAAVAGLLGAWGLERGPILPGRLRQANWFGMAFGMPGLALIAVALDQGVRLDWFQSPVILVASVTGTTLLVIYLLSEWYHPTPFLKLQLLRRRNLGLGFTVFLLLLVTLTSGSALPSNYLGQILDYRPWQTAGIGLVIALPQLVLGPLVAFFLYRKWVDARVVFAVGLALVALACFSSSQLMSDWSRDQFVVAQVLQAVGQPMAVVPLLFLSTSVVQPPEGPYVSGTVNTVRAFGSLIGSAAVGQLMTVRSRFHSDMLLDHAGMVGNSVPQLPEQSELMTIIGHQSLVLSVADAYRVLGILALALVPVVLLLTYIPAPELRRTAFPKPSSSSSSHG